MTEKKMSNFCFYNGSPHINPQERYNRDSSYLDQLENRSVGLIDKIEFYIHDQVKFDDLERIATKHKCQTAVTRLPETKGWTFKVLGPNSERLLFFMWSKNAPSSRKCSVRPSDFKSYKKMMKFLTNLLGRNQIESADVYRTDFAVDIPEPFEVIKEYLFSNRKQHCRVFLNDGERVSGLQIGRKPNLCSAYDKALEAGIEGPLTRIEVQLTQNEKLFSKLTDLPKIIRPLNGVYARPFRKIALEGIKLRNFDKIQTRGDLIRFVELRTLKTELGGQLARKKCNLKKRFISDYGKFVEFVPYPVDLDKVLLRDLCKYFEMPHVFETAIEPLWSEEQPSKELEATVITGRSWVHHEIEQKGGQL